MWCSSAASGKRKDGACKAHVLHMLQQQRPLIILALTAHLLAARSEERAIARSKRWIWSSSSRLCARRSRAVLMAHLKEIERRDGACKAHVLHMLQQQRPLIDMALSAHLLLYLYREQRQSAFHWRQGIAWRSVICRPPRAAIRRARKERGISAGDAMALLNCCRWRMQSAGDSAAYVCASWRCDGAFELLTMALRRWRV